jgi:hypothetical protein
MQQKHMYYASMMKLHVLFYISLISKSLVVEQWCSGDWSIGSGEEQWCSHSINNITLFDCKTENQSLALNI